MLPARLLVPGDGATGTIWHGETSVTSGKRLAWTWAPLRSIAGLAFVVEWRMTGPNTDMAGLAGLRPGRVMLEQVSGKADGALLALAGNLPLSCDFPMHVRLDEVVLGGGTRAMLGEIRTDAGNCRANGTTISRSVPPLIATAERRAHGVSEVRLTPIGQSRELLLAARLTPEGQFSLRLTPAGAAMLPVALPGGLEIETRF